MNPLVRTLAASVALLALLTAGLAQAPVALPQGQEVVPINGIAYWATTPTGPDFEGVTLIPFQARNPTREIWEETLAQNELYEDPAAIPENIQVSASGYLSGSGGLFINDFSECMVYLDPTNPNHLLGSSKFFYYPEDYDFYTGVFESYDGGQTWDEAIPNGVRDYSLTSDPVTTYDDQGNGYFTLLTRGPTGVDMLKKPVGQYWQPPVVVDRTTSTDKQWIMGDQDPQGISPYAGNLYMSWTSFGGPVTGIVLSRSTDGNQTWTPPIALAGGDVQGSIPGVAPDGTVYVVFGRGIFYGGPGTMEFVKSTNGGLSFGAPAVAAQITSIPYFLPDPFGHYRNFRSPASLPGFAVSPTNGNLYITWSDYRHGDADIYFARSTDAGATWSTPVRLNDDPVGNGIDQFQPQVNVAPNGRVAVMWFDRRLPCPDLPWIPPAHRGVYNACIDTFMTRSFDDGATWVPNIRASTQTWDWTLNLPWTGSAGFIGDYQGISSNNTYDFPFWNATADLGSNPDRYQEIFVAIVPLEPPDLSPSTKQVAPELVHPGEVLSYTVLLANEGYTGTAGAHMSDTLPLSTTLITSSLWASSGDLGYDPASRTITWTGAIAIAGPVTVTFAVETDPGLSEGEQVVNSAYITDGFGTGLWRVATATVSVSPYVVATGPADGAMDVPITASVVITFSEAMSTTTFSLTAVPDPGGWAEFWSAGTYVELLHNPFAPGTTYTLTVWALDEEGEALVPGPVPNPWRFTTEALPPSPPYVVATGPADGAMDVPITASVVITFSEAMSTTTFSLTAVPDPGGWSASWTLSDTVVVLAHAPFAPNTTYTLTVSAEDAQEETLVPGPAPNPWSFATMAEAPVILATWPADGAVDVPITATVVITFSEPMNTASFSLTAVPDPAGWSASWAASDTVVLLAHDPLAYSTTYTLTVWAESAAGSALVPGPAPNPWSFATVAQALYRIYLPLVARGI